MISRISQRLTAASACIACSLGLAAIIPAHAAGGADAPKPRLLPVPFTSVEVDDTFWSPRMRVNKNRTLPHLFAMCEQEGRVRNLLRAGGKLAGAFEGTRRHDADLLKTIEAAAYVLAVTPDETLQAQLERAVEAVAAAQRPDGYLHSYVTVARPTVHGSKRALPWFAGGHLLDAAAACGETNTQRELLNVGCRLADLFDREIGSDGRTAVPDHPKIEAALVRLFRVTGHRRYLDLAVCLLDRRGHAERDGRRSHGLHSFDHKPLRSLEAAEGHVICGLFLAEGMFDAGLATGDRQLIDACRRFFHDAVSRRMYVTGAMGRASDERFTEPFALDNRLSIGEGCQSAALVRLAHRLLLLTGEARYADVLERVLYNNLPAAVSLDGTRFYYVNRLSARKEDATGVPYEYPLPQREHNELPRFCLARQPWFEVPCCPPNVAMTVASLGQYVYARSGDAVYVNLYVAGEAEMPLESGPVKLTQQTRYPWDGRVRIVVTPTRPQDFTLCLRIPDWCHNLESTGNLYRIASRGSSGEVALRLRGERLSPAVNEQGYVALRRRWRPGDEIELLLPMPVLRIAADPRVSCNAGRIALQRGPMVYCVEARDHGGRVADLRLAREAPLRPEYRAEELGGIVVLRGTGQRGNAAAGKAQPVPLCAIPYAVWANREVGEMDVWLREAR